MLEVILLSLIVVLFWVFDDIASKVFIKRLGKDISIVLILAIGIVPIFLLNITISTFKIDFLSIFSGIISGIFLFFGYYLVYQSVKYRGVSNSFIIVEIQPIILALFGLLVLNEYLSLYRYILSIFIITGLSLILINDKIKIDKKLVPSLVGNISWTSYWLVFIIFSNINNYLTILSIARITSFLLSLCFIKKENKKFSASIIILILLAGIADGAANSIFGFIANIHQLTLGSILLTLDPIIVWLFGYIIYKERITDLQKIGFTIATVSYILFTLF